MTSNHFFSYEVPNQRYEGWQYLQGNTQLIAVHSFAFLPFTLCFFFFFPLKHMCWELEMQFAYYTLAVIFQFF